MVEVGVADEYTCDLARWSQKALVKSRVRQRGRAANDAGQRSTRDVGIDVDHLPFVAQAVAGDAKPFELEPLGASSSGLLASSSIASASSRFPRG